MLLIKKKSNDRETWHWSTAQLPRQLSKSLLYERIGGDRSTEVVCPYYPNEEVESLLKQKR